MRIALIAMLATALVVSANPAQADHRPEEFCSESGDVCLSTVRIDGGVRKLRISLAAKYFDNYKLCVTGPNGDKTCERFEIEKFKGGVYGDKVRWSSNFPDEGSGAYDVVWRQGGSSLGDKLGFHQ
jgi:hypothetical protein